MIGMTKENLKQNYI